MCVCLFVCFEESKILGFGFQSSAQGLRNSAIDWNLGSIISGAHNLRAPDYLEFGESTECIHDCLGFNRTWGRVYSKNVRTMCERIKRLLDSDTRGGAFKEEGRGGGGKKFLLLKKRENFDPLQNYTQNSDILRKNTLTILLFTYHFLHIKFAISWKG